MPGKEHRSSEIGFASSHFHGRPQRSIPYHEKTCFWQILKDVRRDLEPRQRAFFFAQTHHCSNDQCLERNPESVPNLDTTRPVTCKLGLLKRIAVVNYAD